MRYNSIDAMRLIAAILVVSLHVPFSPIIGKFTSDIARIAVPFFSHVFRLFSLLHFT